MFDRKVDPETAAADFSRWADVWHLDDDVESMEEEDRTSFESMRRRLTRAIMRGSLIVPEDGRTLQYQLIEPKVQGIDTLELRLPTGRGLIVWDKYKDRQAIHKMNAFMAEMCGTEASVFSGMDGRDLKIIQAVAQLFMGS